MQPRTYLVLGGLGLVGRAVVRAAGARGDQVIAISRRAPEAAGWAGDDTDRRIHHRTRFLSLDLLDRDACARCFATPQFAGVTHVVYAALQERDDLLAGWRDPEQIRINADMLHNVLDFVRPLEHVALLQGTKAYGAHLAPMKLPGKESDPRHPGDNFYWHQEDLLRERAAAGGFAFTVFRPQVVCGHAVGSPMNLVAAIGVYAAVSRELGEALCFPGGPGVITEATDADLLADAIVWAGRTPACHGETLNVTNGDVIEWQALWPELAAAFDMPAGAAEPRQLAEWMPRHAPLWERIADSHGLRTRAMADLIAGSWQFADAVFGYGGRGAVTLLSTIRIRQLGFAACRDSALMFRRRLAELQAERFLPR